MYPDLIYIVFIRAALIIEKYLRFSQRMCLIIMSKFILSESVIDQQYRTLDNLFIRSDYFLKQMSGNIRSTLHQFHCRGGSIFLEGCVFMHRVFMANISHCNNVVRQS